MMDFIDFLACMAIEDAHEEAEREQEESEKPSQFYEEENDSEEEVWGYEGETKAGLFRYSFNNTPYLFYTEITHFCDFIESLLQPSEKKAFREGYVNPILSGNYHITSAAKYTINCQALDMTIKVLPDPEAPGPAPMMLFVHGDRFEELYNQLLAKGKEG